MSRYFQVSVKVTVNLAAVLFAVAAIIKALH